MLDVEEGGIVDRGKVAAAKCFGILGTFVNARTRAILHLNDIDLHAFHNSNMSCHFSLTTYRVYLYSMHQGQGIRMNPILNAETLKMHDCL